VAQAFGAKVSKIQLSQGIHKKLQHYISQLPPEVQPKPSVSGRQSTQMSGIGAVLA
jgi:hypothetical protein